MSTYSINQYKYVGASDDGGTSKQGTNSGQKAQTVNNYYFTH